MDTITLNTEIRKNEVELKRSQEIETRLRSSISSKKSQLYKYQQDAQSAAEKARKYAEELKVVEVEYAKLEAELRDTQTKIQTYTQDLRKFTQELTTMTRELERRARNTANTNGAPEQKRASGFW